jgi:stage II sporulation protein D
MGGSTTPRTTPPVRAIAWALRSALRAPVSTLAAVCVAGVLVMVTGLVACDLQRRTLARPAAETGLEPYVRIRVAEAEPAVSVEAGEPIRVFPMLPGGRTPPRGELVTLRSPVTVDAIGSALRVRGSGGVERTFPDGISVAMRLTDGDFRIGARRYGTALIARARSDDGEARVDIAAELPMETYIAGVASAELVRGWSLAAFEAQAVAARSYAVHQRARARSSERWYDLDSTTRDQAFNGLTDDPTAIEAASGTRGILLTWRGEVLRAYYSSTCGGRPASAADVWTTGRGHEFNRPPPLQGRERRCPCDASPLHRWERERPAPGVAARVKAWGTAMRHPVRNLSGLRGIEIEETNEVDRPSAYRLRDSNGKRYVLSAEELRVATNRGVRGQPKITRATRLPSGDFVASVSGGVVTFTGRGFGHGVGLCQFGAQGLAEEGETWLDIVGRYYPGARIERRW